jgi:TRAP-type mannitol/chloroaromatic compound transport system permease small subunit
MSNDSQDIVRLEPKDYPTSLRISRALRRFVDFCGRNVAWLLVPLVIVTAFDVAARKAGNVQYWLKENMPLGEYIFESTILQELEWHLHTAVFALVLGFGYIYNTHVRVDLVRETLRFRNKAWVEFIGLTFFMIPYCMIVIYFASIYAYDSWAINEISASQVGLPHRFIIKSVLVFGLIVAALAGIAVWLQVVFVLWGPQNVRFDLMALEWPEEEGTMIEGKKRLELDELKEDERIYGDAEAQKSS